VILAGFGVVGRAIADRLELAGVKFVLVDLNQHTIAMQRKLGRDAIYGDISNPQVLESAHIEQAGAVVLTIPDDEATLRACRVIRTQAPHVFIAARTSFLSKAMAASQLGADLVTVEEVATAETMARQVMEKISTCPLPMLRHQEEEQSIDKRDGEQGSRVSDPEAERT
jgi:CPA2 family monovalent cation:H+ antiporter-2